MGRRPQVHKGEEQLAMMHINDLKPSAHMVDSYLNHKRPVNEASGQWELQKRAERNDDQEQRNRGMEDRFGKRMAHAVSSVLANR